MRLLAGNAENTGNAGKYSQPNTVLPQRAHRDLECPVLVLQTIDVPMLVLLLSHAGGQRGGTIPRYRLALPMDDGVSICVVFYSSLSIIPVFPGQ